MPEHERKKEAVTRAIDTLYADTTVSQEQTRESLQELREEINTLIQTITAEIGD